MVDAGIARKVDFGEGRYRFEHSYRHPRHFHLICKTCNQSYEFLSSDIEALVEEVAEARNFAARQSVLQIYGTCVNCQSGRQPERVTAPTEALFARDALRIAIATERSGLEFYARAAALTGDARGRRVFRRLADEEKEHLGKLEARYRELLAEDPTLEAHPTFLFFKGAAHGLFAAGTAELRQGAGEAAEGEGLGAGAGLGGGAGGGRPGQRARGGARGPRPPQPHPLGNVPKLYSGIRPPERLSYSDM